MKGIIWIFRFFPGFKRALPTHPRPGGPGPRRVSVLLKPVAQGWRPCFQASVVCIFVYDGSTALISFVLEIRTYFSTEG